MAYDTAAPNTVDQQDAAARAPRRKTNLGELVAQTDQFNAVHPDAMCCPPVPDNEA